MPLPLRQKKRKRLPCRNDVKAHSGVISERLSLQTKAFPYYHGTTGNRRLICSIYERYGKDSAAKTTQENDGNIR